MRSQLVSLENAFVRFNQPVAGRFDYPNHATHVVLGAPLSVMEMALLRYFRAHAGRTLSRVELAEQVWKQRYFHGSRTIDQTVSKLRKKLRRPRERIVSVRSVGYRFEAGKNNTEGWGQPFTNG